MSKELYHRKNIRHQEIDYSMCGAYFVTLCTQNRKFLFCSSDIEECSLSQIGNIIRNEWLAIPTRFVGVELDEFIIMPNHVHGIILFMGDILQTNLTTTLGNVVRQYKSATTRLAKQSNLYAESSIWQRNYYERFIRTQAEMDFIRKYIRENSSKK